MAGGAPGHGEAAPGDHLQTGYRLWLAGDQLEHGHAPWIDPYSFRPEAGPQSEPGLVAVRAALLAARRALLGPVARLEPLHAAVPVRRRACSRCSGCANSALSPLAAAAGGLAFEIAPYRLAQSRGHLLGPISLLLPLALGPSSGRGKPTTSAGGGSPALALVSIPLSGQVHLALAAIPFYLLYALCRTRDVPAVFEASVGVVAAILAGVLIRDRDRGLDRPGRPVALGGEASTRRPGSTSSPGTRATDREAFVFLGWLTPLRRDRRARHPRPDGPRPARPRARPRRAVPVFLAFGTHNPLYSRALARLPAASLPARARADDPVACLAVAGLVAVAIDWALRRKEARRVPALALAAIVAVVLLADLHVRVFHPSAADARNKAYDAVRAAPKGRLVELPVFLPDIHYGSVYLYYEQRVRRERPLGYSTTAPARADVVARHLQPLSCGDWTTGAGAGCAILKVWRDHAPPRALHREPAAREHGLAGVAGARRPRLATGRDRRRGHDVRPRAGRAQQPPFPEPPRRRRALLPGLVPARPARPADELQRTRRSGSTAGGIARLFLALPGAARDPDLASTAGRTRGSSLQRLREVRVGLPGERWH